MELIAYIPKYGWNRSQIFQISLELIADIPKFILVTLFYRRTENSLKIWVFEVKGLSDNKKYFCEVHVDDKIYARTSSKKMKTTCFWGEYFGFLSLPKKAEKVTTL